MKIRVGISKTINLGNFENIKPLIEVEDELESKESYEEGYQRISNICHILFLKETSKVLKRKEEEKKEWVDKFKQSKGEN